MNWNDTIRIGDVDKVIVPEAGMIVQLTNGGWAILWDSQEWALNYDQPDYETRAPMDCTCDPILPAVTPGCGYTREQALELLVNTGDIVLSPSHKFYTTRPDRYDRDSHHAGKCFHGIAITGAWVGNESISELKLAIRRYEVLLAWWEQGNA